MSSLKHFDLNVMLVLDCLYRHKNVSRAAQELGTTQSAISHSLAKLRKQFNDPLFVRISRGVAPTEFALAIRPNLEEFVTAAARLAERTSQFFPAKAEGRIVIACTDFFETIAGAKIFARLRAEAPGVKLSFRSVSAGLPKEQLENGSYDIAVSGFFTDLPEGFYRQKLFSESYSTAYRKDHPRIGKKLTAKEFFDEEHARFTQFGELTDGVSHTSKEIKKSRNVSYASGSFSGLLWVISQSDLLLTAPTSLLNCYAKILPLRVQPCPAQIAPIEMQMVWHGLTNANPLRKWFRQIVREVSGEKS